MMSVNEYSKNWSDFYFESRRQRHADLHFLHLFYRYSLFPNVDKKSALVVGAGDGVEAFEIARSFKNVYATDYAIASVERLKKFAVNDGVKNLIVQQLDQRNLDSSLIPLVDLIVSWSVISYINQKEAANVIKSFANHLNPGGKLIILFEGDESSVISLRGTVSKGGGTYQLSDAAIGNMPGLEMTFYSQEAAKRLVERYFMINSISSRDTFLPPKGDYRVNQYFIVATKK